MSAQIPVSSPLLIVISAPSGGGKTTVCDRLLNGDSRISRAITCTTRSPRDGERDGVDYFFLSPEQFECKVEEDKFLECATVHGNRYGILKSEVLEKMSAGQDVLLNIDVHGAATIRERTKTDPVLLRALVTVFLTPPSLEVLEQRLRKRDLDSDRVIHRRLEVASQEIAQYAEFDYLVLSGTFDEDFRLMKVIVEAERMRTSRVSAPIAAVECGVT